MQSDHGDLVREALKLKASHAAVVDTAKIIFREEFRKACEKNTCRKYNTNWMGPPAVGPMEELMERAIRYRYGLLIQTVHSLRNSFDWKGMAEGVNNHEGIFRAILGYMRDKYKFEDILPLSAGCCSICKRCAYLDGEKCRHPESAVSSLEAYGIDVLALEKAYKIPAYNGSNTVSFVALILFN